MSETETSGQATANGSHAKYGAILTAAQVAALQASTEARWADGPVADRGYLLQVRTLGQSHERLRAALARQAAALEGLVAVVDIALPSVTHREPGARDACPRCLLVGARLEADAALRGGEAE